MHFTFRLIVTALALTGCILVTPLLRAQQPDPQSLRWILIDGPPVVVQGPGVGPTFNTDKPLLAPKIQKEVDKGKKALVSDKFASAQSLFQKAYNAAPGNPQVNFLLGISFMALDKLNEADTYLSRARSIYPQDPATLTAVGMLRIKQTKFDSAVSVLKAAIGLNHQLYLAHLVLASAFLAENKFADSLTEAREALKQGKREAVEAEFIAGASLAGLGRTEAALTSLKQFVRESPDDPAVTDAKQIMATLGTQLSIPSANNLRDTRH